MQLESDQAKSKKELRQTKKNSDLVAKLKDNPRRLNFLKESLKQFNLIKKNQFLERRKIKLLPDDIMICQCVLATDDKRAFELELQGISVNCGERCINRYTCTECHVDYCPCGEYCRNRRFQLHMDMCVYPIQAGGKGFGLSAGEFIPKGSFILQYIGEIFSITSSIYRRRIQEYSKSTCTYLMKINNTEVIDPTYKGNLARFINHSCMPNCITVKWNIIGEICIGIFANRDIQEDEELTFDYQFDAYNTPLTKCLCGTSGCKGYLGLKPTNISQEEWEDHLENMVCTICEKKTPYDDEQLLLCDKCNAGFHLQCLSPPLSQVPKDAWFCVDCYEQIRLQEQDQSLKDNSDVLLEKKLRSLNEKKYKRKTPNKPEFTSSDSSSDSEGKMEYNRRFQKLKNLEEQATLELINKQNNSELLAAEQIRKKAKEQEVQNLQNVDKSALTEIQDIVQYELQQLLQKNQYIEKLQSQDFSSNATNEKQVFQVSKIQQQILRKNIKILSQIGIRVSFETNLQKQGDIFKSDQEMTVFGYDFQFVVFTEFLNYITKAIDNVKVQMGIVESELKVPTMIIKQIQDLLPSFERDFEVNISYNRFNQQDSITTLDKYTVFRIKGKQVNIQKCFFQIQSIIHSFHIQRIYLNSYSQLSQVYKIMQQFPKIDIRIVKEKNRSTPTHVNHPFYFVPSRELQMCIIGTKEQCLMCKQKIIEMIKNEKTEKQVSLLVMHPYKELSQIAKQKLEQQNSSVKVTVYEPQHPRKNITVSIQSPLSFDSVREFSRTFDELVEANNMRKLDIIKYQEQMVLQQAKYFLKFMQSVLLCKDIAYMKNWDLVSSYFLGQTWFIRNIQPLLMKDEENALYLMFVMGPSMFKLMRDDQIREWKGSSVELCKRVIINRMFRQNPFNKIRFDQNKMELEEFKPIQKTFSYTQRSDFSQPDFTKALSTHQQEVIMKKDQEEIVIEKKNEIVIEQQTLPSPTNYSNCIIEETQPQQLEKIVDNSSMELEKKNEPQVSMQQIMSTLQYSSSSSIKSSSGQSNKKSKKSRSRKKHKHKHSHKQNKSKYHKHREFEREKERGKERDREREREKERAHRDKWRESHKDRRPEYEDRLLDNKDKKFRRRRSFSEKNDQGGIYETFLKNNPKLKQLIENDQKKKFN